ncbi:unnamed protein product, partial [Amoebophrya sp. A25]|eukprot:GSA25T00002226001.1
MLVVFFPGTYFGAEQPSHCLFYFFTADRGHRDGNINSQVFMDSSSQS